MYLMVPKQIAQMDKITKIEFLFLLNFLIRFIINKPAITEMIMDSKLGSNNKVAITKIANESNITNIIGGRPSRYMAKINALYTKANPSSCCMTERIAGRMIIAPAIRCDFNLVKLVSGFEINFANIKAVNILHNSAGCKLNPPAIGIQLLDPLISFPTTKVANINNIPPAYNKLASAVNTLLSMSKIKMAMNAQNIAKYICLL